jgi:hypothetical protein
VSTIDTHFCMPIQDRTGKLPGPFVWEPTAADRAQALANHFQTLERLAQRGGMAWSEMAAIVLNKPWQKFEPDYAKAICRDVLIMRGRTVADRELEAVNGRLA